MKIFIVNQHFYPEEFKINDVAEEFVKRGHDVTVLTGKPNYPKGKIYDGYKFWGIKHEQYKGAKVIRVPLIPRGKGNAIRLILNYISYVFFAGWYVLTRKLECDAAICFASSPITQMFPAILLKHKTGCKAAVWVQDLWPESVYATTNINKKWVDKPLRAMVRNIYDNSDLIFIQSPAFKDSILDKGDYQKKIEYVPNWADDLFLQNTGDVVKHRDIMPKGFVVMFAGNVGAAQDFDNILKAAELTKDNKDIHWVVIGDGRYHPQAEKIVKCSGLDKTVHFLGRYPVTEMPNFFCHADAVLVSLKEKDIFSLTVPSKVQCYMAASKPILAMLSGVGSAVIDEAKCGLTCESGDYKALAQNVLHLYALPKEERTTMGEKGSLYYDTHFRKDMMITRMLKLLAD